MSVRAPLLNAVSKCLIRVLSAVLGAILLYYSLDDRLPRGYSLPLTMGMWLSWRPW
jgi:hypothetical protein